MTSADLGYEVLFEGLAVALEALPPLKGGLLEPGLGRPAAAGQLGAGVAALLAESDVLGPTRSRAWRGWFRGPPSAYRVTDRTVGVPTELR